MEAARPPNNGTVTCALRFASAAFELEAIKRAAYEFSDRVAAEIIPDDDTISCNLTALNSAAASRLEEIASQFRIEVLDQDLRLKIGRETEPYRNLILSLAFSKTGLNE